MVILLLLRSAPMGEWEILDFLHRSFGMAPKESELDKVIRSFVDMGYLQEVDRGGEPRLRVSKAGLTLLTSFEREYRAVVSLGQ